jgi:integrase
MSLEKTKDPEIKRDVRTGIFHYRGTPVRGGGEISRSLAVRTFGSAVIAKKDLLLRLRGIDPRAKDVLFGDYLKVFLEERKKRSPSTYEQAYFCIKELLPFFETYTMRQINDLAWAEYVEYQSQLKPGRLLRYDRRVLLMMLLRLKKKGIVTEIPELPLVERAPKRKRILARSEVDLILAKATQTCFGLALFMYKMGVRPGEALGAQWGEFDLKRGLWTIPASRVKTRQSRTVKLNQSVWDYLNERFKKAKGPYVFAGKGSQGQAPVDRYNKQWKRLMERCELDTEITPYYLRHTFLTECAKKVRDGKLSLVLITKYAGTSIEEFERTYLHIEGEETKAVAELMDLEVLI